MADVKFSEFKSGGATASGDIIVGLRSGENTQFTSPADEFLKKSNNLSDLINPETGVNNLGLGSGQTLLLNDSDFISGVYQLTNPCPNYIVLSCATPGNILRLPDAQGLASFSIGLGPVVSQDIGFQSVIIQDSSGGFIINTNSPDNVQLIVEDKSTSAGLWGLQFKVTTLNGLSGNLIFPPVGGEFVYVSTNGTDQVGGGSILSPYKTISFAISQITDNSSSKPYTIIVETGIYSDVNWILKPWIYYNFNNSSYSVSGSVTLDSSWSSGGTTIIQNSSSLSIPASVTLDFNAVGSPFSLFNLSNNIQIGSTAFNIVGNNSSGAVALITNNINLSGAWDFTVTNCFGAIEGGDFGNITVNHTSETAGGNFNILQLTQEGNFALNDSTAAGITLFHEQCKNIGSTSYSYTGSGAINIFAKGMTYFSPPILDAGTSGGSANLTADFMSALPTLINGATFTPGSIADAMSSNYPTPVNFSYPSGEENTVKGAIAGIDQALGGGGSNPSLNDVYNNPPDAIIQLISSRPISIQAVTNASGAEAITTPSTGSNTVANNRILAWTFTPLSDITITALQYEDALFTQTGTRETGIYLKSTQQLLTSVLISKTDPLVGGYRTNTLLIPLPVQAGVQLVFSTVMAANETNHLNNDAVPNAGITIDEYGVGPASSLPLPLQFPQTITSTPNVVQVGSFIFDGTVVNESLNTYDPTSNSKLIQEIKTTARAAVIEPVMTLAQLTAIGLTAKGSAAFVSDSTPPRPYRYDGSSLQGVAYVSEVPPPLPTMIQGQVIMGGTGGTPVAGDLKSVGGTVIFTTAVAGHIDLEANLSLQQVYDIGQTIVLNSGTDTLTITDNGGVNTLFFNSDGTNPFFQLSLTSSYSIPYGVYSDATFSGMTLQQGGIAFITTSNRLAVFDGMSIQKLAQLSDFSSGSFTPSISNVAGTSALTILGGLFTTSGIQPGNVVTFSLDFSCSVSATLCTVQLSSLPVFTNNFSSSNQAKAMGGIVYTDISPNIGDGQILNAIANNGSSSINVSFQTSNTSGTKIITITGMYVIQ